MSNAAKDENGVSTLICALSTDGTSIVRVKVNPVNKALKVSDASTGTYYGRTIAERDENSVPVAMGVSSVDMVTPVEIYADANGNILIDSA